MSQKLPIFPTVQLQTTNEVNMSLFRYANDSCCNEDKEGTDVYFHVVDPRTGKVLPFDDPAVQRWRSGFIPHIRNVPFMLFFSNITNPRASANVKIAVSSILEVQSTDIHAPYPDVPGGLPGSQPIPPPVTQDSRSDFDGLPAALISIGCLVFAFAFAALIYLCIMRRKWVNNIEIFF